MTKSILNDQLDLEVLRYGIENYSDTLPTDTIEILLEKIKSVQNQESDAVANLIKQFQENQALDKLYERSLRDLRRDYPNQERAKSLTLTGARSLEDNFTLDDFIIKIEGLINRRKEIALNKAQMKILKSLNRYLLTIEYLSYTIDQSQETTQMLVEDLWKKGYIDYLQSPILYIIFPGLRSQQYRQASVDPNAFLTLTRRGYFHLYPFFKRLDQEAVV
jgi:hypothetical protein